MVYFPLAWEDCAISLRPLLFIPHFLLGMEGSNFLADFSAISACSTSSFQVRALTAPSEFLLGLESCAYMSAITWVMASLQDTSEIGS